VWATEPDHGFMAAAVLTAVVDVACGCAAMTLMPPGSSVLTIEYKANFLAPAQGEKLLARGRVIRPGRTVTVCAGDVVAVEGGHEKLVAPPTINYQVPDPDCDLHYVPNGPVAVPIRAAISNSFGFGGHNDCLLVRAHGG